MRNLALLIDTNILLNYLTNRDDSLKQVPNTSLWIVPQLEHTLVEIDHLFILWKALSSNIFQTIL